MRFKVDQIARTLPGPVLGEWRVRTLDQVIALFVKDRGYDREISIDETPADLWSLQGELPPPFESVAEKRWAKENKASPYTMAEKRPGTGARGWRSAISAILRGRIILARHSELNRIARALIWNRTATRSRRHEVPPESYLASTRHYDGLPELTYPFRVTTNILQTVATQH